MTIFRTRLDPAAEEEYTRTAVRVHDLAEKMPGFRSIKTFRADDGERVSIIEFESEETLLAWKEHPEHREAQRLGRERFYTEFSIQTATPHRSHRFRRS